MHNVLCRNPLPERSRYLSLWALSGGTEQGLLFGAGWQQVSGAPGALRFRTEPRHDVGLGEGHASTAHPSWRFRDFSLNQTFRSSVVSQSGSGGLVDKIEILRSEDLLIRAITGDRDEFLVVTFAGYTDNFDLNREGFGEHILRSRRIDAIHVVNRNNDWYQRDELPEVLALIRTRASHYHRVFTYGSSMGGYAAIRFAHAVGAQTAIAIAPQYSVDPVVFPYEDRWNESRTIDFLIERQQSITPVARTIVFYDPMDRRDRLHVERIAADTPVTPIAIPFAGHATGVYLAELGMLSVALLSILDDRFDPEAFMATARQRRREAAKYFAVLSSHCGPHQAKWALSLARQAVVVQPADAGHMHNLAERHAALGNFVEAAAWEDQAALHDPGSLLYRKTRALHLLRHGDTAGSRKILLELVSNQPRVAEYHDLVARTLSRERRFGDAIGFARKAVALDAAHPHYRKTLRRLERRRITHAFAVILAIGQTPQARLFHRSELAIRRIRYLLSIPLGRRRRFRHEGK
jgi:hypothetical protein